jgi:CelD/BcsL family acetyltransferase involved in cellulose biosynthesis
MATATTAAAKAPPMRAQIASTDDALAAIEDGWRRLAEAQGNAFVGPDWFHAWLRHYGLAAQPAVVAVHGPGDVLIGVLPLASTRHLGRPVLRFAGASLGDCFHPVAIPGHEADVARVAGEAIATSSEMPPAMLLENAQGSDSWIDGLASARPGMLKARYRTAPLPYIRLPSEGWEHYLAAKSRNFRNQVGRKRRMLERGHVLRFRRTQTQAELGEDLETFFDLHEARWQSRGGSEALTADSRDFHRDFARVALSRGWLRLWFLELDEETVAAWYGWRVGPRYSYYQGGFSPRRARESVGFVLLAHTIRSAFEEGAEQYDLLLGGENYKARFATDTREVQTIALGPRTDPVAMRLRAEAALWHAGRRLSPSLRASAASAYRRIAMVGKR